MYTYSRVFPSMKEEDFEEYNKLFDRESEREYNPYNEYSRGRSTRYIRY